MPSKKTAMKCPIKSRSLKNLDRSSGGVAIVSLGWPSQFWRPSNALCFQKRTHFRGGSSRKSERGWERDLRGVDECEAGAMRGSRGGAPGKFFWATPSTLAVNATNAPFIG